MFFIALTLWGFFIAMKYFKITCIEAELVIVAKDEEEAAWIGMTIANENEMNLLDVTPYKMHRNAYFPNKWQAVKDIELDLMEDVDWQDFYEWRVCSHELLDGYHSIIRVHDKGKVKECAYKNRGAAVNKVKKLMKQGLQFDIATDAGVTTYPHD